MDGFLDLHEKADFEYVHSRALTYALMSLKLDPSDAEDVVCKALLRAIPLKGEYAPQPRTPFLRWFLRVVVNLVRDEYRGRKRAERLRLLAADGLEASISPDPETAVADLRAEKNRLRLMNALPGHMRPILDVWLEQHQGQITRKEAAARLGFSIAAYEAAKKRVGRELEKAMLRLGIRAEHLWSGSTEIRAAGSGRTGTQEEET